MFINIFLNCHLIAWNGSFGIKFLTKLLVAWTLHESQGESLENINGVYLYTSKVSLLCFLLVCRAMKVTIHDGVCLAMQIKWMAHRPVVLLLRLNITETDLSRQGII